MGNWEDRLDDFIDEEEDEALDDLIEESGEEIMDEILSEFSALVEEDGEGSDSKSDLASIFGSEKLAKDFFAWLDEQEKGTHIVSPQKIKEMKRLGKALREIFPNAKIIPEEIDMRYQKWGYVVKSDKLIITEPKLLKKALTELSPASDILAKTDGSVQMSFAVNNPTIKAEEEK